MNNVTITCMFSTLKQRLCERIRPKLQNETRRIFDILAESPSKLNAKYLMNVGSSEGAVRQQIGELDLMLELFFLRPEGKIQPLHVRLDRHPRDGYSLIFEPKDMHAKHLWRPYLEQGVYESVPIVIVYAEPLFYRFDRTNFVRAQDQNFPQYKPLREVFPWAADCLSRPARNYVAAGDVTACLILTRWFERCGIPTLTMPLRQWQSTPSPAQNVILIGNSRTFPAIPKLLSRDDIKATFQIHPHHIENTSPLPDDHKDASGIMTDEDDVDLPVRPIRGIVTRVFNRPKASWVTILTSNHSRFFEAAANDLTGDTTTRLLVEKHGLEDSLDRSYRFELLGETFISEEEECITLDPIDWKAVRPPARTDVAP